MVQRVRLPVQGGNVKIVSSPAALSGTTIAGFEGQSLTISQLAVQIAGALGLSTQAAKSPGSSGSAAAAIVLGPGLTGGGPVVGAVPINLNASIPWNMQDEAEPEWMPVPGPGGARGAQGSNGPGVYLMDDPPEAEWLPVPGQPGATGATGPQGPAGSGTAAAAGMWIPEDAPEADWMPVPGAQGARGLPGIAAAVGCWIPEDATDDPIIPGYGPVQITVVTGANPTATIGLTAINGSATTFTRSDGAPALSQAIVPTWSGQHKFQVGAIFSGALVAAVASSTGVDFVSGHARVLSIGPNTTTIGQLTLSQGSSDSSVYRDSMTFNTSGGVSINAPLSGIALGVTGVASQSVAAFADATATAGVAASVQVNRPANPTNNSIAAGACLQLSSGNGVGQGYSMVQNTGTQLELWNLPAGGSSWLQGLTIKSTAAIQLNQYGAGALTTDSSGNVTATSDRRIKRKVRPFRRGIDAINQLAPVLHGYTKKSGLDQSRNDYAGFIAQNVQEAIPEAVGQMSDGMLTLSDRPIIAALVNAVQELSRQVSELKQQLASK